jgi:hypothetical protein
MREWLRNVVIANEPRKGGVSQPSKRIWLVEKVRELPESARIQSSSMLDVPCELALEKM